MEMNETSASIQNQNPPRERLEEIYQRLRRQYGPQNWWPGNGSFEIAIGAILTQSTNWGNVKKALNNLKQARIMSPEGLRSIPEEQLAHLIYSSGYFNAKAKKLKAFVQFLGQRFNDDIEAMQAQDMETLRKELLAVHGIGEETADDILLYIAKKPSFVIDAYTRRIVDRLDISPKIKSYGSYRNFFMSNLPPDEPLFNEYHALLVSLGKYACKKQPLCEECCLLDICPTGQARSSRNS